MAYGRPRVTAQQRKQAHKQAAATAIYEKRSVSAALRHGATLERKVLSAYRRGDTDMRAVIQQAMAPAVPELRDLMALSHLVGVWQVIQAVPPKRGLSMDLHSAALKIMRRRLGMSVPELEDLQERYEAQALVVVNGVEESAEKRVEEAIELTVAEGMHVRQGVQVIRAAFIAEGIVPGNSYAIENIYRTQTHMGYSAGAWQTYQDPAIDEILWGYRYVTVGDGRVRPNHAELEGMTLPKGHPRWETTWPPNGYSCRCDIVPLTEPSRQWEPPPEITETYTVRGEERERVIVPGPDPGWGFNPGVALGGTPVPVAA